MYFISSAYLAVRFGFLIPSFDGFHTLFNKDSIHNFVVIPYAFRQLRTVLWTDFGYGTLCVQETLARWIAQPTVAFVGACSVLRRRLPSGRKDAVFAICKGIFPLTLYLLPRYVAVAIPVRHSGTERSGVIESF